jgi:hypothetical protein
MSTDVYERIISQIANKFESGARIRLKPWNAAYSAGRITHPLRGTSRADVKGVSHAAAQQWQGHVAALRPQLVAPRLRTLVRQPAEHRFADGYELVVFDLPAAKGYPATIGWELFGGLEYMTLVASGQAASFGEAKAACEKALVQALAALRHPPKA